MNTHNTNNFCIILAGGKGKRLWPSSRQKMPKQFLDFFGTGETLLQTTFKRFSKFVLKENIYISTNDEYLDIVKSQLPEIAIENILSEPVHRNTAPSISWATAHIFNKNKGARIIISPSDQAIINDDIFRESVETALDFTDNKDGVIVMGIAPSRAEPGYGYLQKGNSTKLEHIFQVKSFTEKPDREFATLFMNSGEFLWNTGIFIANAAYLTEYLNTALPPISDAITDENNNFSHEEERAYIKEHFSLYPNITIERVLLEQSNKIFVMQSKFGWADLGTWHSIYDLKKQCDGDNIAIDSNVIFENSKDNIVKISNGKIAVIDGLEGFIVSEKDNVLLICKKEDSSALIRKYINNVQINYGDEFV